MTTQQYCDCESYEPCHGECCGPGQCSCSLPKCSVLIDDGTLAYPCDSPLPCQVHTAPKETS